MVRHHGPCFEGGHGSISEIEATRWINHSVIGDVGVGPSGRDPAKHRPFGYLPDKRVKAGGRAARASNACPSQGSLERADAISRRTSRTRLSKPWFLTPPKKVSEEVADAPRAARRRKKAEDRPGSER